MKGGEKMEILRKGSDRVSKVEPLGCCFPPGTNGYRYL
jgi:hypothetical protein